MMIVCNVAGLEDWFEAIDREADSWYEKDIPMGNSPSGRGQYAVAIYPKNCWTAVNTIVLKSPQGGSIPVAA